MDDDLDSWEDVTKMSLQIQINLVGEGAVGRRITMAGPACAPCQIKLTPVLPGATSTAHHAAQRSLQKNAT